MLFPPKVIETDKPQQTELNQNTFEQLQDLVPGLNLPLPLLLQNHGVEELVDVNQMGTKVTEI